MAPLTLGKVTFSTWPPFQPEPSISISPLFFHLKSTSTPRFDMEKQCFSTSRPLPQPTPPSIWPLFFHVKSTSTPRFDVEKQRFFDLPAMAPTDPSIGPLQYTETWKMGWVARRYARVARIPHACRGGVSCRNLN